MTTALAPITRQTVGRTFIAAISVLGIAAAVQLGVVGWMFYSRFRAGPPTTTATTTTTPERTGTPLRENEITIADPFGDAVPALTGPQPLGSNVPPAPSRPTPIPSGAANLTPDQVKQERFNESVEHGRTLRLRGDHYAAVNTLLEAQSMNVAMDLKSPAPLAELALTYEKMGWVDRAAEAWRSVYNLGEGAGIHYAAAEARLKLSQVQAVKDAQGRIAAPVAPPLPTGEKVGLTLESKLGLMELKRRDETDPSARKFTLFVPVRAKPKARIDVREVIVQVLYFDVVNDRALDKTTAQVSYKWTEPPADWGDGDIEQLEVSYALPNLRVADEVRKYFGYTVSVYYKNALQDFRADPPALAERYPPDKQLSSEPAE